MARRRNSAGLRIAVAGIIGVVVGGALGPVIGFEFAPALLWVSAAVVYLVWTWLVIGRMDASTTAAHATREDPTIGVAHVVLVLASVASLFGVALMLVADHGKNPVVAVLGVASVVLSWLTVHTVYTLGYAGAYYTGENGGIDFNQKPPPAYADFAYIAFTLGMTYQVSDTTITDPVIRRLALRHSLLSYLLGALVLALTINLIGSLGS